MPRKEIFGMPSDTVFEFFNNNNYDCRNHKQLNTFQTQNSNEVLLIYTK